MPASVPPRLLRLVASAIGALCTLTAELAAQSATGKLVGQVQDEAGTPLVEAQIYLVGSAFSATSDASGHYLINNLPARTWAVQAYLARARLEEAAGDRHFLRRYDQPMPSQAHLVEEARAALARLSGET